MVYFDPETQQTIPVAKHSGDLVYDKKPKKDNPIARESVPIIGAWKDYTGSQTLPQTRQQMMFAGMTNKFKGTIAGHMGAKLGPLNEVGENAETTRRRQKKVYKDFTLLYS